MRNKLVASSLLLAATFGAASAQDSVSIGGCLPGDAVSPWADGSSFGGSEQVNDYVVDMTPFTTSWGTEFGVAPVLKTSKANFSFFNNLPGAQAISRKVLNKHAFFTNSYAGWTGQGFGINNSPSVNAAGTSVDTTLARGAQFAATMSEFGTTDQAASSNGVITALMNIDPTDPLRLFVRRVQTAMNGCDANSDLSSFGIGAVDANGHTAVRSDGFGILLGGCNGSILQGNNVYIIDAATRNASIVNVIEDTGTVADDIGLADATHTTTWVVQQSGVTHGTPSMIPSTVTGGDPIYIGTDFNNQYVRGSHALNVTGDTTHLAAGITATRGTISYSSNNFGAPLNSTRGIAATLARPFGTTDTMNLWGLGPTGNVTGTVGLMLPPTITDNATGFTNLGPGPNAFDHYHSQVPFRGGNGNVAVRVDPLGNLLAAAEVDHPTDAGPTWDANYIAVAKIDGQTGVVSWTMAAYTNTSAGGKPILNGPSSQGGVPIGQMIPRNQVLALNGPSMSAPAFDSAGNVWIIGSVEIFGVGGSDFGTALLRAVYDPANFSYELELVMMTGDIFFGQNTGLNWILTDLRLTDSDSIDSGSLWSGNVTDDAFLGYNPAAFAPADSRTLGGLVIQGRILYDADPNGMFEGDCVTDGSLDEEYRVMLYVGSTQESGYRTYGTACAGSGGFTPIMTMDGYPAANQEICFRIENGFGPSAAIILFGLTQASIPFGGAGCVLNINALPGPVITLPLSGAGPGTGTIELNTTLPANLPPFLIVNIQAFIGDPGVVGAITSTKGLQLTTQP